MPSALRYRIEDERSCIDIRLKTSRQLFDLRDPAPFRERDLDPAAVEHILSCVRELPKRSLTPSFQDRCDLHRCLRSPIDRS